MTDAEKLAKLLAKKRLLQKAIGEFQSTGEVEELADPANNTKAYDYSHLLPKGLQDSGIRLHVYHQTNPGVENEEVPYDHFLEAKLSVGRKQVGTLQGDVHGKTVVPMLSEISQRDLRGKGIGQAMYTALFAHAKRYCGVTHAAGSKHSTFASKVHSKLAAMHGLNYVPVPNIGGMDYPTEADWEDQPAKEFDDKFASYRYTLKSELDKAEMKLKAPKEVDHYSPVKGLKRLDPSFQGTAHAGAEKNRPNRPPRLYFYWADTKPESIVATNSVKYRGVLPPGTKLYDLDKDGLDLMSPTWTETDSGMRYDVPDLDDVERTLIDKGYHGYFNYHPQIPNALVLFKPLKVSQVKDEPKKMRKDEQTDALDKMIDSYPNRPSSGLASLIFAHKDMNGQRLDRLLNENSAGDAEDIVRLAIAHPDFDPERYDIKGLLTGDPLYNGPIAKEHRGLVLRHIGKSTLERALGGLTTERLGSLHRTLTNYEDLSDLYHNPEVKTEFSNAMLDVQSPRNVDDLALGYADEDKLVNWLEKHLPNEPTDSHKAQLIGNAITSRYGDVSHAFYKRLMTPNVIRAMYSHHLKNLLNSRDIDSGLIEDILANTKYDSVASQAAAHPNISKKFVDQAFEKALAEPDSKERGKMLAGILNRKDTTQEQIGRALDAMGPADSDVRTIEAMVQSPSFNRQTLDRLLERADSGWGGSRYAVNLTDSAVRALHSLDTIDDGDIARVLKLIDSKKNKYGGIAMNWSHEFASHPNGGVETLKYILDIGHGRNLFRYMAAHGNQLPDEVMDRIMAAPSLREGVLGQGALTKEQIDRIIKPYDPNDEKYDADDAENTHDLLLQNTNVKLSDEHIKRIVEHPNITYGMMFNIMRKSKRRGVRDFVEEPGPDPIAEHIVKHGSVKAKRGLLYYITGDEDEPQHVNAFDEGYIMTLTSDEDPSIAEAAREIARSFNPDFGHPEHINVSFDTTRARKLRDLIMSRTNGEDGNPVGSPSLAKPVRPKDLPNWPKLLDVGRLPDGNISAAKIQSWIDTRPMFRYGVGHTEWRGAQRHSDEPSKVFQLAMTGEHLKQMKEAGVYDTFRRMHDVSFRSGHPVTPWTIGWVRYTGDKDKGIHIDEVQSDLGQSMAKQGVSQIIDEWIFNNRAERQADREYMREFLRDHPIEQWKEVADQPGWMESENAPGWVQKKKLALGTATDEEFEQYLQDEARTAHAEQIAEIEERFPEAHLKKIQEILFQGKHANVLLHEAFQQHLRDKGLHGTPVAIHAIDTKGQLSGLDMAATSKDKRTGKFQMSRPGHFRVTYEQHPKEMGFEPSTYGSLPTQSNQSIRAITAYRLKDQNTGEVVKERTPAPTFQDQVRKFEDASLEAYFADLGDTVLE